MWVSSAVFGILLCSIGICQAQQSASINGNNGSENNNTTPAVKAVTVTEHSVIACSGHSVDMKCPHDHKLEVVSAFWGRDNSHFCNGPGANPTYRCNLRSGGDVVKHLCNDHQTCRIQAAPGLLGDCAQETTKYLLASYRCIKDVHKALLCEQTGPLKLACKPGSIIETHGAFYGREDLNTTCPHATAINMSDCSNPATSTIINKLCNGKTTCDISARTSLFGDPCPGSYKYLRVNYTCSVCENEYGNDAMCEYWRNIGECEKNPTWMIPRCRAACSRCDTKPKPCENAWDSDAECTKWEGQGDCPRNPAWMFAFCRKACLKCDKDTACVNQFNNDTQCDEWMVGDQCKANLDFMFSECAASCFGCDPQETPSPIIKCENRHNNITDCEKWAQWGECHKNAGWMLPNCLKTCLGCTKDPVCADKWPESRCQALASADECENNPVIMHRNCWKTCMNCQTGATECRNRLGNDAQCEYRARLGECKDDPATMMDECYQSCTQCQPLDDINNDCVNRVNDTLCDAWADRWECVVNPDYMMTNCKRSCTLCNLAENQLAQVGSPATPGKVHDLTKSMTYILPDPINVSAKLKNFGGFFVSLNPIWLQVWRTKANGWSAVHSQLYTPKAIGEAETIPVEGDCVSVEAGDRIGFTTIGYTASLAHTFDPEQTFEPTYFRDSAKTDTFVKSVTDGLPFRQMTLPHRYSLSAAYDSRTICPGADPEAVSVMVTKKVYFDLTHGGREVGRIVFGLFEEIVPKTTANFIALVQGHNGYHYQGNIFHRVINGFVMQAGDVVSQNGYGWTSIYGSNFPDENFILKHVGPGILQMANAGPDTNGSQFAVMSSAQPHLNDRHVVFGRILEGMEVYRKMEAVATDSSDKPIEDIVIARCGIIRVDKPFPINLKMEY